MSTITSNWKQNCFSPVNKSPSKMAFSFSKANRFSSDKENKSQIFYNVSPKVDKRATTFGYGNKYDFTKDQPSSPPPNVYSIPDTFDPESKHKPGFCFGQSREGMIITGPLASTINNKNPGPGAYEPLKKTSHISYSLRGKVKPPQPEAQKVPGPGTCTDVVIKINRIIFSQKTELFSTPNTLIIKLPSLTLEGKDSNPQIAHSPDLEGMTHLKWSFQAQGDTHCQIFIILKFAVLVMLPVNHLPIVAKPLDLAVTAFLVNLVAVKMKGMFKNPLRQVSLNKPPEYKINK